MDIKLSRGRGVLFRVVVVVIDFSLVAGRIRGVVVFLGFVSVEGSSEVFSFVIFLWEVGL